MTRTAAPIGPILFLDHVEDEQAHLAALFILPKGSQPPVLTTTSGAVSGHPLAEYDATTVFRARFTVTFGQTTYHWNGQDYTLNLDLENDQRLAYVACNGEETGDLDREGSERNVMWARLCAEHRDRPFALLLHGGDQVYADEVTDGHPLTDHWPRDIQTEPENLDDLNRHLRERLLQRYAALYASPDFAWLAARVPSVMQWDDHDICDGWGSLPPRATQSAVGRTIFSAAREAFLIFQAAATDGDLPARFADPQGRHLGWAVEMPGYRIVAPDLRSERSRTQIMGPLGWDFMQSQPSQSSTDRYFLMSSVPLLGPRLSLLETLMMTFPRMQKYEDDLRDQWQSHAHRDEWQRVLRLMIGISRAGQNVVVLSGEIHLATRAVMPLEGNALLHQLVASGIAHRPPPRLWARFLGALATLGDAPIAGKPIRIDRIPGQAGRYVAERNYLTLDRQGDKWSANWQLEESGRSPDLML
ncbi:alkaline phosphatase D family protein [Paracoccus aestuariivivens]|uniref:Alkaline phosphatase family protein n=1 Tax=Paracoccus aestuariivivens TaxID=1820333 RepID=A0A6L6JE62_9RHOB|nr:alkaline phosphatase D family protein [Paracoccus aestuariivivens]MTH79029.1 alkaline phosphatase family protein [Paracoccus aestuariivivens]